MYKCIALNFSKEKTGHVIYMFNLIQLEVLNVILLKVWAHTLTCYCFDHILRDFRDFFIHGYTQHLDGHPVQGPATQRINSFNHFFI